MKQSFTRAERIALQKDFDAIFKEGKRFRLSCVLLRARANALGHPRFGVSVGRRAGNAVRRNRIKRLLREAFRRNKDSLGIGCDVVAVPRPGWRELSLAAIEPEFREALDEIRRAFTAG